MQNKNSNIAHSYTVYEYLFLFALFVEVELKLVEQLHLTNLAQL